jgi:hypothetical protein
MKDEAIRLEIQKILNKVAKDGAYHLGDVLRLEEITRHEKTQLQESLKELLGISDCHCDPY